jgi:hypothetical protein
MSRDLYRPHIPAQHFPQCSSWNERLRATPLVTTRCKVELPAAFTHIARLWQSDFRSCPVVTTFRGLKVATTGQLAIGRCHNRATRPRKVVRRAVMQG